MRGSLAHTHVLTLFLSLASTVYNTSILIFSLRVQRKTHVSTLVRALALTVSTQLFQTPRRCRTLTLPPLTMCRTRGPGSPSTSIDATSTPLRTTYLRAMTRHEQGRVHVRCKTCACVSNVTVSRGTGGHGAATVHSFSAKGLCSFWGAARPPLRRRRIKREKSI